MCDCFAMVRCYCAQMEYGGMEEDAGEEDIDDFEAQMRALEEQL